MKYTTFRNSLLAGGALTLLAVIGGSVYVVASKPLLPPPTDVSLAPPISRGVAAIPSTGAPEGAAGVTTRDPSASKAPRPQPLHEPLREIDRELLQLYAQSSPPAKLKDVFPNRPYKVNLYVEGGHLVRAKVDLNRNGKWDEKWSFEPAGDAPVIKRQVSPDDDDINYPLTYKVADKAWVAK